MFRNHEVFKYHYGYKAEEHFWLRGHFLRGKKCVFYGSRSIVNERTEIFRTAVSCAAFFILTTSLDFSKPVAFASIVLVMLG